MGLNNNKFKKNKINTQFGMIYNDTVLILICT